MVLAKEPPRTCVLSGSVVLKTGLVLYYCHIGDGQTDREVSSEECAKCKAPEELK